MDLVLGMEVLSIQGFAKKQTNKKKKPTEFWNQVRSLEQSYCCIGRVPTGSTGKQFSLMQVDFTNVMDPFSPFHIEFV